MYVHTYVQMHTYIFTPIYVYVYTPSYIYVYMYLNVSILKYMYIHNVERSTRTHIATGCREPSQGWQRGQC
jgi:hypothetical protein